MGLPLWAQIALKFAPMVLGAIPGVPSELAGPIAQGIVDAEASGQPGADKKASVMAIATDVLNGFSQTTGMRPNQQQDILSAVSQGVDETVAVVNAIHAVRSPAPTPTTPPEPPPAA